MFCACHVVKEEVVAVDVLVEFLCEGVTALIQGALEVLLCVSRQMFKFFVLFSLNPQGFEGILQLRPSAKPVSEPWLQRDTFWRNFSGASATDQWIGGKVRVNHDRCEAGAAARLEFLTGFWRSQAAIRVHRLATQCAKRSVAQRLSSAPGGSLRLVMGTLSMTAGDLHTKYHRPPARSSDLLCDMTLRLPPGHRFSKQKFIDADRNVLEVTRLSSKPAMVKLEPSAVTTLLLTLPESVSLGS